MKIMFLKIKGNKLLLSFFLFLLVSLLLVNNCLASNLNSSLNLVNAESKKSAGINYFFFLKVSDDTETQKILSQLKKIEIPSIFKVILRAYNYNKNTFQTFELTGETKLNAVNSSSASSVEKLKIQSQYPVLNNFYEFVVECSSKYKADNLIVTIYSRDALIAGNNFSVLDSAADFKVFSETLKKISLKINNKINILHLDMDNIQCLELAYEISDYADYIISSEEKIPSPGTPYFEILSNIFTVPELDMRKFAFQFVSNWHKYFKINLPAGGKSTLSAFKTAEIPMITEKLNVFLEDLCADIKNPEFNKIMSGSIMSKIRRYTDFKEMIDIFDLGRLVNEEILEERVEQSSREFLASITNSILKNSALGDYGKIPGSYNSFGVSAYMPLPAATFNYYDRLRFANETLWKKYLETYYSLTLQKN